MTIEAVEKRDMGRVTAEITVENLKDLWDAKEGQIADSAIRRATIPDALVDTGATFLSLPTTLIQKLGLRKSSSRRIMTSKGPAESDVYESDVYEAVRLTIQGRTCTQDVMEVPDQVPALVGQLPLEALDFVVDPIQQRVSGNPAHGGEQMYDLLSSWPIDG
jgi:predicted aspartyl protease